MSRFLRRAAVLLVCALPLACGRPPSRPWPEADRLFRGDARWLGGDAAYSVALGGERTLWLFGDSFVEPGGSGKRSGAALPRNTIALQVGLDPSRASMRFFWKESAGRPSAFFGRQGEEWLWPAHGVRLGRRLLLFFMRVRKEAGGLGFRLAGSKALLVEDPDEDPLAWRFTEPALPRLPPGVLLGSAVLAEGDYLYAYGAREPGHEVYLARWPLSEASKGALAAPRWWGKGGWGPPEASAPVFAGASEFSVHADSGGFVEVQSSGFGATDITARRAPRPQGPWSAPVKAYRPEESGRPGLLVYAGKAHPHLRGGLLATYAANPQDLGALAGDMSVYFPRFVRLELPWRR